MQRFQNPFESLAPTTQSVIGNSAQLAITFCLGNGAILFQQKTASILPLHKKRSCYDVMNYRPIALLPSLSEVFQKFVHRHLYSYVEPNNYQSSKSEKFWVS